MVTKCDKGGGGQEKRGLSVIRREGVNFRSDVLFLDEILKYFHILHYYDRVTSICGKK